MSHATGGSEFAAIDRLADRLRAACGHPPAGELWIGDDAAVVEVGGGRIVVAADAVVGGVHADLGLTTAADLGWRALAVNVSDLAAMGCVATRAVVTIAAPDVDSVDAVYEGLAEAAAAFGCPIVGGDLTSGPALVVSVTVLGDAAVTPAPVGRRGAQPGDELWASGPFGAAAAGLRHLRAGDAAADQAAAHARPQPRTAEGVAARELGATAMIDVSDGFVADLAHLLDGSGVGVVLDTVPVATGATRTEALTGGDDYELVWACPAGTELSGPFAARGLRPPLLLGHTVADPAARTVRGQPLTGRGWDHWA